jgi:hypothetical protein
MTNKKEKEFIPFKCNQKVGQTRDVVLALFPDWKVSKASSKDVLVFVKPVDSRDKYSTLMSMVFVVDLEDGLYYSLGEPSKVTLQADDNKKVGLNVFQTQSKPHK